MIGSLQEYTNYETGSIWKLRVAFLVTPFSTIHQYLLILHILSEPPHNFGRPHSSCFLAYLLLRGRRPLGISAYCDKV